MGRTTAQPLSAGEAVLGLVIELPGNSYQLERRLEGRFGSAQFGHATAYHALKRLTKQGLIRPIEDSSSPAGPSADAPTEAVEFAGTIYEVTPEGVTYFKNWLRASIGDTAGARGAAGEDRLLRPRGPAADDRDRARGRAGLRGAAEGSQRAYAPPATPGGRRPMAAADGDDRHGRGPRLVGFADQVAAGAAAVPAERRAALHGRTRGRPPRRPELERCRCCRSRGSA